MKVRIDIPIQNPEEDVLGRAKLAESFSEQLLSLDASEGVVTGVLGPWGSGKTSFVNLVRPHLKKAGIEILDFNPWMFSGTEQLVESFFVELSAQLRGRDCRRFDELAESLERYGEIFSGMGWLPVVGPWIERLRLMMKPLAKLRELRKEGITGRKGKVEKALADLTKPLVVVVDDIDRLTTPEIRAVFKLVRLTANFPNIIYITAFDRARVENALGGQEGISGRDYLEKILQWAIDLPEVPEKVMVSQITQAIDNALSGIENAGPFDKERWPDVFHDVVRPLIRSIRHVRRYATAIRGTVRALNGQIALVDVLGLEAVRMSLPDLFSTLHKSIPSLTTTSGRDLPIYGDSSDSSDSSSFENQIKELIDKAGDRNRSVARRLISNLFPLTQADVGGSHHGDDFKAAWVRERRVAHEDYLRLYLERVPNKGSQASTEAEQAWRHMADGEAFDNFLRTLPAERRQDVIGCLGVYENQFAPKHVVPGSVVLLNLLPELPDLRQGFFDLEPRHAVRSVVLRLLQKLENPDRIEDVVRRILPQIEQLSAKWELIMLVGHQNGTGHELVLKHAAQELERTWREKVRSAPVESLAKEKCLLQTFVFVKQDSDPDEPPLEVPDSSCVTRALLESARTLTQEEVGRVIHRSFRLEWDALVDVYSSEEILRDRIEKLKSTRPRDLGDVLELVDKYLAGYRHQGLERGRSQS